jgi:hypothetical protein
MMEGWPERIEEAQKIVEYSIGGILSSGAYGAENDGWDADRMPCHDCRVVKGQLHVPSCVSSSALPAEGRQSGATVS